MHDVFAALMVGLIVWNYRDLKDKKDTNWITFWGMYIAIALTAYTEH